MRRRKAGIVQIAGPERPLFNDIVASNLKAIADAREVAGEGAAICFGGQVEECSLVLLGEARLGRIGLDEWLRCSQARVRSVGGILAEPVTASTAVVASGGDPPPPEFLEYATQLGPPRYALGSMSVQKFGNILISVRYRGFR